MTTLPPWVIDEWCTKGASFYREQIDWIEYEALREAINQLRDLQTTAVRNKDDRRAEELKAEIERQEEKAKAHRSRYSGKHEARNMEVIVGWRTGKQKRGTALQESNIQVRNRWFLTEYRRLVKLATESKQVNNPPAIYEGPIGYPVEILDPRTGKPSKGFTVALARACGFKGKNDPAIYRQVCDIKINGLSSEI